MEQGAARERATERPSPPFGDAARVPEQARGAGSPPRDPGPIDGPARADDGDGDPVRGAHRTRGAERPPATGAFGTAPATGAFGTDPATGSFGTAPVRRAEDARGEHTHGETAAPASRVVRHSVRSQILDALRAALVGGELVPGEVYSAPALGERFGVSATPVREAMQRLAVEGAVEVVPNRGFRVVERTARELAELAEVRALIEVPVMLRLARTVPAARWAELRPLAEATSTAAARGDRAHYAEADRAFHRAVLSLAGNQQLLAVADDLHRRSQWPLISAPTVRHGVLVADAAEHTALLDALIVQDLTVVEALVREHFTGSNA
ncbi:GntR family transcriptional regulator [Streptomyces zaomyceticus]|uniref:GntR family transcriptional regulator n=1 Tax=Streptomyces zaomyceticus TaxID=68286 RepID=UPI0019AFA3B8|nr:GntR family transcriptional regulator [Streptomyces zaomyceticus]GHG31594.1 GntR family transcriptional regulator [Streptomyces zaomyceticus]